MTKENNQLTPEVIVAISMALHQVQEESKRSGSSLFCGVGTGQPARSPWASKILTLRKLPGQY